MRLSEPFSALVIGMHFAFGVVDQRTKDESVLSISWGHLLK